MTLEVAVLLPLLHCESQDLRHEVNRKRVLHNRKRRTGTDVELDVHHCCFIRFDGAASKKQRFIVSTSVAD